jgi:hypothetical protein
MAKYKLLSVERDAKTSKSVPLGWLTGVLYMAPAKSADGVHNMCCGSSEECVESCLNESGMAEAYPSVIAARIAKTLDYIADFKGFVKRYEQDLKKLRKEAHERGLKPCTRPNGTTDQAKLGKAIARRNPWLQVYDYTKLAKPWLRQLPNYHLTFSFSGKNLRQSREAMEHGINVAVVFKGRLPETWNGWPVINGDLHDLRFLDPQGVVVGLRPKGRKIQQLPVGGFVQLGRAA